MNRSAIARQPRPGVWRRWRFQLSGLVLILPWVFLYQALNPPAFPPSLTEKSAGPFTATPRPLNREPPYTHHGERVKDYMVTLCEDCVGKIRQGYLVAAAEPPSLEGLQDSISILHGNEYSQHVHARYPQQLSERDRLWLVLQTWSGEVHTADWPLP